MLFTLIIPVYQTPSILTLFLTSLSETLEFPSQIIFINDGSGNEVYNLLLSYGKKNQSENCIVILNNLHCSGCVKSINSALNMISGKYVVMLDSDIILTPKWQSNILEFFDSTPDAGVVCPLLLFPQNNSIQCAGMLFSECMARRKFFLKKYRSEDFPSPYKVQSGVFAFCAIKSHIIKQVGLLDTNFFNGYEDIDYQFRIRKLGFNIYINPKMIIYHWEKSNGIHRIYNKRNNTASLWKKYSFFIKNDLWECIRKQLDLLVGDDLLIPIDLCESRIDGIYFFEKIIPLYSISYVLDYSYCVSIESSIWLPEILPIDSCHVQERYLFFCDTFIELLENDYWFRRRKKVRKDDIIVDLQGNVILFEELADGFWPGRNIRY